MSDTFVPFLYELRRHGVKVGAMEAASQRDEVVVIHKIEDQDIDWLERPLTPEREAALNPPGIGPR